MATGGGEEERNVLTILWRIENLSCFHKEFHGVDTWSPEVYPHTLEDKMTLLDLYPWGESVDDANVYLDLCTDSPFPVDCEFSFLTCDGTPLVTRKGILYTGLSWEFEFKMTDCLTQEELFVTKKSTFLHQDTLTVRCRLWKSQGNFPHNEFFSVCNRIELSEGSILWPIRGLNLIQSETFPLCLGYNYETIRFKLICSLTGDSQEKPELNIKVTGGESIKEDYLVKLKVSVLGNGQEVMKLEEKENSFSKSENEQSWVVPKFVLSEDLREKITLLQCEENLGLLYHLTMFRKRIPRWIEKYCFGTLNLEHYRARTTCTLTEASCETSEQNGDTPAPLRNVSTLTEASCHTSEQSDNTAVCQKLTFNDFELRADNVSFPVHKMVLSERSPFFSAMFSNETEESNHLDVPDLDALTLNRLLTFLYTGILEPDLTLESSAKLYYAAEKFQVDTLKERCSSILQSHISNLQRSKTTT